MVKRILLYATTLMMTACGKVDLSGFFISPGDNVDSRFEQSIGYTGDKPLDIIETDEEYVAYICTDIHLDKTQINLDAFMSDMRNDEKASLGLILGDVIDRKGKMLAFASALEWKENEQKFNRPVFVIPGNHDMFFGQWDEFKELFGASVYYVEIQSPTGTDLVIALDSASGTLGKKQMEWLKTLLATSRSYYRHCIIITHTNIFKTDNSQMTSGNMPLEETYELADLFSTYDVDLVFQGHDHYREDLYFKGVRYTLIGTIKDAAKSPEYLKVHISQEGFEYEWVSVQSAPDR